MSSMLCGHNTKVSSTYLNYIFGLSMDDSSAFFSKCCINKLETMVTPLLLLLVVHKNALEIDSKWMLNPPVVQTGVKRGVNRILSVHSPLQNDVIKRASEASSLVMKSNNCLRIHP